ncbi:N-acetylmuramic acid 6-phosphate etherase [Dissostichus eleginoides]|uniref:N-acetylmuramic acid 6-phosphate etherase n=1 Tax=Dissostichus eleginoides TaxID=100907 RepID=A0AAD9FL18_DISEL|nr:N-acetylmuramic acid 6-phosphate etherase [Dissostichus eleginoides]
MLIKGLHKQEPSLTAKLTSDLLSLCIRSHTLRIIITDALYEPLTKYLSTRYAAHATPQHPLFLNETGKMATRFWFQKHFHNVLHISDIVSEHYSSHSFRIGAASTPARLGISDQTTQVLGRWSSQAYHTYIRNNLNDLRQAHAQLSCI